MSFKIKNIQQNNNFNKIKIMIRILIRIHNYSDNKIFNLKNFKLKKLSQRKKI